MKQKPPSLPHPEAVIRTSVRQRPLMMTLGLASAALSQPALMKGRKSLGNEYWNDGEGRTIKASMEKVVDGLRRYQLHPYERKPEHKSVVWSDGSAKLSWYAAKTTRRNPRAKAQILVLPSMINGSEILDIIPESQSLVRWLASQGFDVFVLDWGRMVDDPELKDIDSALTIKFSKLATWLRQQKGEEPLYGLGYCMGGILLAGAETLNPDLFDGLIFVATPWDFEAGGKESFAEALRVWVGEGGLVRVAHLDYMPNEWLQLIFSGTDPSMVARKYSAFADMDMGSEKAKLFVAVEDWVNGGQDLPSGIIRQAVSNWYVENKTMTGKWKVKGTPVNAGNIEKDSLVIIPAKDRIVPPDSAKALVDALPNVWVLTPDSGHISMMVSSSAEAEVWEPIKDWIFDRIRVKA